jgi:hypothetical protein
MSDSFLSKTTRDGDCLLWTAAKRSGYGVFHIPGTKSGTARAHRWAYEATHGQIPEGMVLDHICGRKECVNVDHLEPVSQGENVRRHFRKITQCVNGHPYDEANTYVSPSGQRSCRACNRERGKR